MTTHENGRPRYENRITNFYDGIDDIEDFTPGHSDIYQQAKDLITEVHELNCENQRLREAAGINDDGTKDYKTDSKQLYAENTWLRAEVRRLDLDCRSRENDIQEARREVAVAFAEKLKKIRERSAQ